MFKKGNKVKLRAFNDLDSEAQSFILSGHIELDWTYTVHDVYQFMNISHDTAIRVTHRSWPQNYLSPWIRSSNFSPLHRNAFVLDAVD